MSNLLSVPTDCDQRDKRLGWMGDAGLSSDSMLLNFHMDTFLPHYSQLMDDDKVKGPTLSDVVQCCTGYVFRLIIEHERREGVRKRSSVSRSVVSGH